MSAPESLPQSFGFVVRAAREQAGLSIDGLADASGLSSRMLIGIEHGKRNPSLMTIAALARGLECRPGSLVDAAFDLLNHPGDI